MRAAFRLLLALLLLPIRILGGYARAVIGRPSQPAVEPHQAAATAQAAEEAQLQADDRQDTVRQTLTLVRRVAALRAEGQPVDPALACRIPDRLLTYVTALSAEECGRLASTRTSALKALLDERGAIPGVRLPSQVGPPTLDDIDAGRRQRERAIADGAGRALREGRLQLGEAMTADETMAVLGVA